MRRLDDFMPCPAVARYFRSSPVPVRRVKLLPENRSETVPARVPSPGAFGDVIVTRRSQWTWSGLNAVTVLRRRGLAWTQGHGRWRRRSGCQGTRGSAWPDVKVEAGSTLPSSPQRVWPATPRLWALGSGAGGRGGVSVILSPCVWRFVPQPQNLAPSGP